MFFLHSKCFSQGFTLLELLIVIGIIGILSSVILISYKGYTNNARLSNTMQWAKSVQSELGVYAIGGWSFDNITGNIVFDDSGNGNNGTIYGEPNQVGGIVDKALSFDGVNDYVNVGDPASGILDIGANQDFTISCWFKTSLYSEKRLVSKGGSGAVGYELIWDGDGGIGASMISMYIGDSTGYTMHNSQNNLSLSDNQWHYVVATADRDGNVLIYVDSILNATRSASRSGSLANSSNFSIGKVSSGSSQYFNGLIDDVRIYKEVLAQVQIQHHYAEGLKTHQNLAKLETSENAP